MKGFSIKCLECGHEYLFEIKAIGPLKESDDTITVNYDYEGGIDSIECKCGNCIK